MTLETRLTMAALAIATGRSAIARGDIGAAERAADDAEALLRYDSDDDPNLTPEPSQEWQANHDALTPVPTSDDIDTEDWPSRY